jgi:hypothetical protein
LKNSGIRRASEIPPITTGHHSSNPLLGMSRWQTDGVQLRRIIQNRAVDVSAHERPPRVPYPAGSHNAC